MSIIEDQPRTGNGPAADSGSRRERDRVEFATIVERDPATLVDAARLAADLSLDSLAMMTLRTWLETRGVLIGDQQHQPATVGEVLTLLERAGRPDISIQVTGGPLAMARATDFTVPASDGGTEADPLTPVLHTRDVRLNPVEPDDMRFLYALATHPQTCFRWRYRGAPPPIDRFAADLWSQVLVQFVARRRADGEPVGHLVAYGADMGQRFAYLGAVFRPEYQGSGLAAQVVVTFVRYLFHAFPMRKLYIEVPGFNWAQMRSGEGRLFQVEGIMREHEHYAGRYWDRYLCAIYRDVVDEVDTR